MDPDGIARSVAAWEQMRPRSWRGHPYQQLPSDMLRYAELIHELHPPWVLECGTADGGCALFLTEILSWGKVISVDWDLRSFGVGHPRLTLLKGGTTDPLIVKRVRDFARRERGLILLDDDHSSGHVLAELDLWAPLADYLIVEDTLMGWLPQYPDNPRLALEKWLPDHPEFAPDPEPQPTNHPGGWLRRVSG